MCKGCNPEMGNPLCPVPCARQKRLAAHRFFACWLNLFQDEDTAACADSRLVLYDQSLPHRRLPLFYPRPMDLELYTVELHERARPRVEGTDAPLQFMGIVREIELSLFLFEHWRIRDAFFRLRG